MIGTKIANWRAWARTAATAENLVSRGITVAGAALLLVSSMLPWFRLPALLSAPGGVGFPTASIFQLPFQIMCGIAGVACFAMYSVSRFRTISWLGLALLPLLGTFPYLVMLRDPPAALVATELQATNDQLVNETMAAVPNQMQAWKRTVNMLMMVRPLDVLQLRIPNGEFLSAANLDIAIIGFGFSNEFLDFMGWGFPIAITAAILLLSGAYLARGVARFRLFQSQSAILALAAAALVALGALPILASNYLMRDAQVLAAEGLYSEALTSLAHAANWLPISALSTRYHDQVGAIRYQLRDRDDPDYHIYLGNLDFDAKQYEQATLEYGESLRSRPNDLIASHSFSAAMTNLGIQQYGRGQFAAAIYSWQSALRAEPMNTKALYEIQIGYFQVADLEASRQSALALLRILGAYRLSSLSAMAQSYVQLSWCSYRNGDYEQAFSFYRQSVEPTLW